MSATSLTSGPFTPRDCEADRRRRRDSHHDWPFTYPLTCPPSGVSPSLIIPLEKILNLSTLRLEKTLNHCRDPNISRGVSNWGFRDNRISETSTSDTRKGKLNLASLLIILVYFCANLEFRIALVSVVMILKRRSESTSLSSNGDLSDNLWSVGSFDRKYVEVISSSKADYVGSPGFIKSDIPQKVLESLFNIPKSTEHDKDTMNWRNVVKQIQTLGPGFNPSQRVAESKQRTYAKGDEYHVFREDSQQHWDLMKSYYRNVDTQQLLQQQANMQADNEDDQQPSSAAGHYGNDY
ncbi:hypothetical protein Fmac_028282 [Flemingia macrophylla]|uniref:Uncharacterized protein n=1 Tax=Flemingia macrophylla TaxID=520843 RepID=A0ABD1L7G4_9FABA